MTAEDLMAMKAMSDGTDMSSYEHFMVAEKTAKRPSGTSIAAITIGSAALLTGIGAWIFGGVYAALWIDLLLAYINKKYDRLWEDL